MSVDSRTETIPASGQIRLANANFFFVTASTAAFTIVFNRGGSSENFANILTGLKLGRLNKWDYAFITGTAGTVISFFYGITAVREDETDLNVQLASISGTVTTSNLPATTVADSATVAVPNAAQTVIVPINLTRRRFSISFDSSAAIGAATVFFRKAGGANSLIEVQAGVLYNFEGTYGIDVRNDSGGALVARVFEES